MKHLNTLNEEEHNNKNRLLHNKIERKEKLTREEESFVCHCLRYENLLLYPFCLDEFFTRTFLGRSSEKSTIFYDVRDRHNIVYEGLVREWAHEINKTNHTDQLMQIVAKETRDELRALRKRFPWLHRNYTSYECKFRVMLYSLFRNDSLQVITRNALHFKV